MKILRYALLLAFIFQISAHADTRFFRIKGPAKSRIMGLTPSGYLTWTNATTNGTYIVQAANSLSGKSNWTDYLLVTVTNRTNTVLIYATNAANALVSIPAGSFTMGDNLDGYTIALPLHTDYISAFKLEKYDVTKGQWDSVYQWAITNGYAFDNPGSGKGVNQPVYLIDWYDAVKWCNARSEKEGRTPAYYTDAGQTNVFRAGNLSLDSSWVNWSAGYRLPTEAEWEKAARGGFTGQRFPWGAGISWSQANYSACQCYTYDTNSISGYDPGFNDGILPFTSPVGYFPPNGYGLYDMSGNVFQWCWDREASYSSAPQTDPRGSAVGAYRVSRGGGYDADASSARVADRYNYNPPDTDFDDMGFRCVLPGP